MQKIPNSLSMSPQKNWQLVVDSYTPEIFTWNLELKQMGVENYVFAFCTTVKSVNITIFEV